MDPREELHQGLLLTDRYLGSPRSLGGVSHDPWNPHSRPISTRSHVQQQQASWGDTNSVAPSSAALAFPDPFLEEYELRPLTLGMTEDQLVGGGVGGLNAALTPTLLRPLNLSAQDRNILAERVVAAAPPSSSSRSIPSVRNAWNRPQPTGQRALARGPTGSSTGIEAPHGFVRHPSPTAWAADSASLSSAPLGDLPYDAPTTYPSHRPPQQPQPYSRSHAHPDLLVSPPTPAADPFADFGETTTSFVLDGTLGGTQGALEASFAKDDDTASVRAASPRPEDDPSSPSSPLARKKSKVIDGEEREELDLKEIDMPSLKPVPHLSEQILKPRNMIRATSFLHAFELFVSVTTIVHIMGQLKDSYVDEVNFTWFATTMDVLTFLPILCFFQFFTLFNNYYAQLVYYYLLSRGVILDFANTATLGYFITHPAPLLYLSLLFVYAAFTVGVLSAAGVFWHEIFVFCENVAVGMLLFWYRQQGVESRLVSLSQFAESFEDENKEFHNIDATSLTYASRAIKKLVVAKSERPTYTGSFRVFWFRLRKYSKLGWFARNFVIVVAIGLTFLLAYGYYLIVHRDNTLNSQQGWNAAIRPCVAACMKLTFSGMGGPAAQPATYINLGCNDCLCRCITEVGRAYIKYCPKYIPNIWLCNSTSLCANMESKCVNGIFAP